MSRVTSEPPTIHARTPQVRSDRSSRAEAFAQAHAFVNVPEDALHVVAVFTIEYFERAGLSTWSDFPVEAFAGVQLPGELYGFDSLRASATQVLPLFFVWLGRTGDISSVEATALAVRARNVHRGVGRPNARSPEVAEAAGPPRSRVKRLPRGVAE